MIIRILIILAIVVSLMVGCGADYGRVKVNNGGFEIEAGVDDSKDREDKPKHCPPGHRKKGWCD